MYDAAILFNTPQMTEAIDPVIESIARAGGHVEWTSVPVTAVESCVLSDADLIKLAGWGLLPSHVEYACLLLYFPDDDPSLSLEQSRNLEASMDAWDAFVEVHGIEDQPDLTSFIGDWQTIHEHRQRVADPPNADEHGLLSRNPCAEIPLERRGDRVLVPVIVADSQGGGERMWDVPRATYERLMAEMVQAMGVPAEVLEGRPLRINVSGDLQDGTLRYESIRPEGEAIPRPTQIFDAADLTEAQAAAVYGTDPLNSARLHELGLLPDGYTDDQAREMGQVVRNLRFGAAYGGPGSDRQQATVNFPVNCPDCAGTPGPGTACGVAGANGEWRCQNALIQASFGPQRETHRFSSERPNVANISRRWEEDRPLGPMRTNEEIVDSLVANRPQVDTRPSQTSQRVLNRTFGGMQPRRQQEAAQRRQEAQHAINWLDHEHWTTPAGDSSGGVWTYQIDQMEDQHLWNTIIWCVREVKNLFRQYNVLPPHASGSIGFRAKTWLREQPVFRSLVQQAVIRQLTFPRDTYQYLREYALERGNREQLRETRPWRDPGAAYQLQELETFRDAAIHVEQTANIEAEIGKPLREIDLNDE